MLSLPHTGLLELVGTAQKETVDEAVSFTTSALLQTGVSNESVGVRVPHRSAAGEREENVDVKP